ncbi:MAG: MFS transporter, partial [Nitrospiraceae bacterium]
MADNDKAREARTSSGWELLRTKSFGLLFSGQAVSQIGDSMNKVALLWFVYELTGSAFKMTVVGLLQTIPPLVFGPLIGVYLDRMKKKPVLIWVDLIRTGLVALIPLLYAMEALTLERLYVLVFATSIVSTVFGPALASAVPLLVPRAQLTAANGLIQSTTNIGLLIGPAVCGVGIAMIGAHNVLYLDAATFLVSALCLMPIYLNETLGARPRLTDGSTILQDLLVGFRFVFVQHRTVLLLMLTATLYSLGASAFVFLLPVFATQLLDASAIELGWLWSSLGIGMLAASVWLAWINQGDLQKRLRLISAALAVGAVAVCT